MHAVMDRLMLQRKVTSAKPPAHLDYHPATTPQHWIGFEFIDRKLTREHVDEMIDPALRALEELEVAAGGEGAYQVLGVEQRVRFPGIPGAFGTVDLVLGNDDTIIVLDWKFGAGVGVKAVYEDGDGAIVNPQLLYYLAATKHTLPALFRGKRRMIVAIVQPRAELALTYATITPVELKYFREDLERAVLDAIDRDPPRARGEHCRFAPCKINCPLWTGPMLELAALKPVDATLASAEPSAYAKYLAHAKYLTDQLATFSKEINDQLHDYLEAGGSVPGWRLKAKAKQRQWVDVEKVADALEELGFADVDIWQDKLVTFASADATARRLGVKIPDELRVAPPTNETTVCPTDDPAPVVVRHQAIEQFAASLAQLKKPAA